MKTPTQRARQLVTAFQKYFDKEFDDGWKALIPPKDTVLESTSLECFAQGKREQEIFINFIKENSTAQPVRGTCQCALAKTGN